MVVFMRVICCRFETILDKHYLRYKAPNKYCQIKKNKFKGWKHINSDGSKSEIGVGADATTGNCTESALLPKFISIFTAETHPIHLAWITISATKLKNLTIFTDSRSCLQALQKQILTYPKIRKLKHTLVNL